MRTKKHKTIISAGDAVTAKLIQDEGFDGIWVSGFETCARLGLPDNGSITMTEMLNVVKPIVDRVKIPVWVDVDTGYGNFQRTVEEFERIGAYGVCIEDNLPEIKKNSLWGGKQELMDKVAFGKKIDVPRKKLKIMARTEALIRGFGTTEARNRLHHYRTKGADYLLPHARESKDIIRVLSNEAPYAIVPTMFPLLPNTHFFSMGYSMVIWANQTERVKIKSIRRFLEHLRLFSCPGDYKEATSIKDMRSLMPSE